MKAITLTQPWASLVAIGAKRIETRSWKTAYRGPLAIHAAKGFPDSAQYICFRWPFRDVLSEHGFIKINETFFGEHRFPLGAVIATCELIGCIPIPNHPETVCHKWVHDGKSRIAIIPPEAPELYFGQYEAGRYAWILANVRSLSSPIEVKGMLGLWEWKEPWINQQLPQPINLS